MPKRVLSTGCSNLVLYFQQLPVKKRLSVCYCMLLILCNAAGLHAEGSKELSANGGYRAFLFSSATGNASFPFPTLGTMKVYVKAGETIYTGSSAQGFGSGTINLRAPDGSTYTSGNAAAAGLISNRSQELAGPLPNAGGYTPFTVKAGAGQEGVWEIDFISQSNGVDMGNPDPVPVNANWTQPSGQYITAFDVSVRDVNNQNFLTGRVFTNVFSGILGTFDVGFNAILNILTKDGYQYTLDNNGQAGNGFTFFVNNKGFRNTDGTASYLSVDNINSPNVNDPTIADTQSDITHKIFFNTPAADLPTTANTPGGGTTWLLNPPGLITISNVGFTGIEGTAGVAGTNPLGANFLFTSTGQGSYTIAIDVNNNGVFTDPIDRNLTGTVSAGANQVYWDGLNGQGNKTPAGSYNANITLTTKAGEVHFPFFDVERNVNGIKLTRINGGYSPDDTVYWDDTPVELIGTPPNPIKNLGGISSLVNGHKWGTPASSPQDDNDFGNNRGIDTWSYILSAPVTSSVAFQLREADLAVDTIISNSGCAGGPVAYTVLVKNNGPDDVTGAKFRFAFPNQISGITVSSVATTGNSAISAETTSANEYDATLALAAGAIRTFSISGTIAQSATGNVSVTASILRPADVTDPDATNPTDDAPPTDPVAECNALPSGTGCNNIKTSTTVFVSAPNAGADQTVFQYETATLTGTGTGDGVWTQAAGDPVVAAIATPSSSSTTVSGLNNPGLYHFIYTNASACTDTVLVTVVAAGTTIPNIFTPNNDGLNDVFKITGLESYPGSQLIIFNRWGNEVYRADNYLNNWNGSSLAEGTYYYILNRREHNGSTTPFKGWVFLKRTK